MDDDLSGEAEAIGLLAIIVILILAYFGLGSEWAGEALVILLISLVVAFIAGDLIRRSGSPFLKKAHMGIRIWKFEFSVSIFAISIIVIKLILF